MQTLRRKQFILPQDKLNEVKKALGVKTETEAVLLSLEAVLHQKKLQRLVQAYGKSPLKWTRKSLREYRESFHR